MMCEKNNFGPTKLFSAIRFKALDYVFETSTTQKVTMNLLALPAPYLAGTSDLYPHRGKLLDGTYRTPWIRGKVISSCKLFIGGSVFEELEGKKLVNSLERFSVENNVEVILSSNPDSLDDFDQDEFDFLKESQINDPCQESFYKWTPNQRKSENDMKDLFILEELISVDYLPQFRRHLPSLRVKLSRLKTLPVADPLLSPAWLSVSEDAMFSCFRRCASYEKPPEVDSVNHQTCTDVQEEFLKEPFLEGELLLLPAVVDTLQLDPQNCNVSGWMNVCPEPLEEPCSVLDLLHDASLPKQSVDVSQYDEPHELRDKMNECLTESEFSGRVLTPAEIELDSILSPIPKKRPDTFCLSTSHLLKEELYPFGTTSLVSARTQKNMEAAVWRAEKHLTCVAGFLLSEPPVNKPACDFQPLSEVLSTLKLEKQSFSDTSDKLELQVFLGHSCEFTEKMTSKNLTTREDEMEDFKKLSPEDLEREVESSTPNLPNKALLHKEFSVASPQSSLMQAVSTSKKGEQPTAVVSTNANICENKFSEAAVESSAQTNTISTASVDFKTTQSSQQSDLNRPCRSNVQDKAKSLTCTRRQSQKDLDPLSDFITLRSLQPPPADKTSPNSANTEAALEINQQPAQKKQRSPPEETRTPDRTDYMNAVSGDASREQKPAAQKTSQFSGCPVSQSNPQDKHYSRVVQIQATASQQRAYCELLALALPCLTSAKQTGLNFPSWRDFSSLAPDQTHFLLKQQERSLCRTPAESAELVRDQELLFNQAALIHMFVTFKELLLKCDLRTALEYLTKAAEVCDEQSLKQLLKRLQVILFLSHREQETNFKLLELQQLLADWLLNKRENNSAEKILIMLSVDSDESRSKIINSLSQATGAAVTSVCPDGDLNKLNGADVVSSVYDSDYVVMSEQHIGPDFPWNCFSLVVEFDHPGPSPWPSVCSERSIDHLTFNTSISDSDADKPLWRLEDNVPFTVLVTEGLRNCPLLLQTLESSFSVNVLERSHCATLQMLGGIHNYTVITVDESTAIIIQEQEELCEERASEGLVMRLTALSLQYSSCWLFLHCPDSRGGGFSSEAFNNLVLIYSSLVLFAMKPEELDVKVLFVSEVLEMARFITQICFTTLMSSDQDPVSYLSRDWLTAMPSQEDVCLSQFPCINPLVSQLMLNRAPSLQWLLGAPLVQLQELFPEVPHKVLKMFSDTTSLYWNNAEPKHPEMVLTDSNQDTSLSHTPFDQREHMNSLHSEPFCSEHTSFLHEAVRAQDPFSEPDPDSSDFRFDLKRSFGSPNVDLRRSWTRKDPWKDEEKPPLWSHRAAGRVVGRVNDDWTSPSDFTSYLHPDSPLQLNPTFSCSPPRHHSATSPVSPHPTVQTDLQLPESHHITFSPSPPPGVLWGQSGNECLSSSRGTAAASASYGSRSWTGLERKRSFEAAGLLESMLEPLKRRRLSYERVPGRRDGQTRLKLF